MRCAHPAAPARTSGVCRAVRVSYDGAAVQHATPRQQGVLVLQDGPHGASKHEFRNNITAPPPARQHPFSDWQQGPRQQPHHSDGHLHTQPHLNARQLTSLISHCQAWRGMQALLHQHAQDMNTVHLSAMVVRLAKVVHAGSTHDAGLDSFLQDLSMLVSQRMDDLDPRALANILWAVARLGFRPSYTLLQRYLFATYVTMPQMRGQELANLAWAVAHMGIRPGGDWMTRLCTQTTRAAQTLKPQELANLSWALAELHGNSCTTDEPSASGAREASTSSSLASSHTGHISQPTAAGSQVQQVVQLLQLCICQQIEHFRPQEVMMALMALHRLQLHLPHPADPLQYTALLQRAAVVLGRQLAVVPPRDVCHLVCLLAWDVRDGAARHRGSQVSNWATRQGQAAVSGICQSVEALGAGVVHYLDAEGLVRLGWALAELGFRPSQDWYHTYQAAVSASVTGQQSRSNQHKEHFSFATAHAPVVTAVSATPSKTAAPPHSSIKAPWTAASLTVTLWALARLHPRSSTLPPAPASPAAPPAILSPSQGLPPGIQTAVAELLPQLSLPQLARVTWVLGQLHSSPAVPLQPQLAAPLAQHIKQQLTQRAVLDSTAPAARCDHVKQLSMLLEGMSLLQLPTPPSVLLSVASYAAADVLSAHSAVSAPPGFQPAACAPASMHTATTRNSDSYRSRSGPLPAEALLSLFWQLLRHNREAGQALLHRHGGECTTDQCQQQWQQGQATAAHLVHTLAPAVAQGVHHLQPLQVYLLVRRLARADPHRLDADTRVALVTRMCAGLQDLPPAHLPRALVCIAQLQLQPSPAWVGRCLRLTQGMLGRWGLRELSHVLWCLAKWRVIPSRDWMSGLMSALVASLRKHAQSTTPTAINSREVGTAAVRSLWALGSMHVVAPAIKSKLTQLALTSLQHLSPAEALWLLRVLTSARAVLLHSQWRKLLRACGPQPRPLLPQTDHTMSREGRRRHARVLLRTLRSDHWHWARRWPTLVKLKRKLKTAHGHGSRTNSHRVDWQG